MIKYKGVEMRTHTHVEIEFDQSGMDRGFYVYLGHNKYLHVDGVVRGGALFNNKANCFWRTKALAQEALQQYVSKEQVFGRTTK